MLIVYIVEWTEGNEMLERWFSFQHLAEDFAKKVGGIVIEKDVS